MRESMGIPASLRAAAAEVVARALWPPVVVFCAHVVASLVFDAYRRIPLFDLPMHLAGGAAIATAFERTLAAARRHGLIAAVDRSVAATTILGLTCAAALAWECAEFLADRWLGTTSQGGLEDTLGDMLLGAVGGAIFVAWRWLSGRSIG